MTTKRHRNHPNPLVAWGGPLIILAASLHVFEFWTHIPLNRVAREAASVPFMVGLFVVIGVLEWGRKSWLQHPALYIGTSMLLVHLVSCMAFVWGWSVYRGDGYLEYYYIDNLRILAFVQDHLLHPFILGGWLLGLLWSVSRLLFTGQLSKTAKDSTN